MMCRRTLLCLTVTALLAACAGNPVPVVGIPGPNKDFAAFQKDEQACRTAAGQAAGVAQNRNVGWQQFFAGYAKCQTAHGNGVEPVPWVVAYATYLGHVPPYPVPPPYPPPAYPYPYPYAPYPYAYP